MAFIKDFELKNPDGAVSFHARVDFHRKEDKKTLETEVHIITSGNIEAVYLINPEIEHEGLPDTFRSGNETFRYIQHACLAIDNEKEAIEFTVFIFPKTVIPSEAV